MLQNKQIIFIGGTIGAGKTTIINKLKDIYSELNPVIIKEYIDYDNIGEEKLNLFLNGSLNAFEFQVYIVNCYIEQFKNNDGLLYIFERHPLESIIFAAQKLSFNELKSLYNYIINVCRINEIPLPKDCKFVTINNNDLNFSIESIVNKKDESSKLFIHLKVNQKVQINRLITRNRLSDIGYLMEENMDYLTKINSNYDTLEEINYNINPKNFYLFYKK